MEVETPFDTTGHSANSYLDVAEPLVAPLQSPRAQAGSCCS